MKTVRKKPILAVTVDEDVREWLVASAKEARLSLAAFTNSVLVVAMKNDKATNGDSTSTGRQLTRTHRSAQRMQAAS